MVLIAGYKTKELTQFAGPGHLAHNWLKHREREAGREKEEGRELPMMQAESRMVPSEGRGHTRLFRWKEKCVKSHIRHCSTFCLFMVNIVLL